ncbi:hypothetical protein ACQB60_10245 [Actinomycetota bacterium Odt1-20B]
MRPTVHHVDRPHSRPRSHRLLCTGSAASRTPLGALEERFLALAAAAVPLTLPGHLVCEDAELEVLAVDQVRTRLAHPATSPELRRRTWREVVRRAQELGAPWDTVAVAMTVPVLRRMLARLARPAHLERAEVEQEALVAVAVALRTVDVNCADAGRELFAAADRAVHRLAYAARRQAVREVGQEVGQEAVRLGRVVVGAGVVSGCGGAGGGEGEGAEGGASGDEFAVLARAVQARVVDVAEARLIARTRLQGEPMRLLAEERGVSVRQLYRHRAAAEGHLAAYLRERMSCGE